MRKLIQLFFIFSILSVTALSQELTQEQVKTYAAVLDRSVSIDLKKNKINNGTPISDEVFLRRIYLDLAGRIPTFREIKDFLQSKEVNKRAHLIDALMKSKAYNSQMFNYWADILRAKDTFEFVTGLPYLNFLKTAIKENYSYKRLVTELLQAKGAAYAPGNGATGYFLRDTNMPLDNMSNTIRIFLGTQMTCAQCHDHPFDRWTQKDFYQLTAFMSGMNTRRISKDDPSVQITNKEKKANGDDVQKQARSIFSALAFGVSGNGSGLIKLPHDYQYDDAKPGQIIEAGVPFGPQVKVKTILQPNRKKPSNPNNEITAFINSPGKDVNAMKSFTEWVTSDQNDRFVKLIANRMWKKAMGIGIIEPVDDMSKNTMGTNPELMSLLMKLMLKVKYDLKEFQRVIYNTAAYQNKSFNRDLKDNEKYRFQGPLLRRMSAEQIWDSLLVLIKKDVDAGMGPLSGLKYERVYNYYKEMSREERFKSAAIMAGVVESKNPKPQGKKAKKTKRPPKIGGHKRMAEVLNQGFVRASELRSPAPPGHFLRKFGQSDREDVQNSSKDASITQTLTLMNGVAESEIINNKLSLINTLLKADSKLETAFLSILTRKPSSSEYLLWQAEQKKNPAFTKDLIWVLINTNEFLFIK